MLDEYIYLYDYKRLELFLIDCQLLIRLQNFFKAQHFDIIQYIAYIYKVYLYILRRLTVNYSIRLHIKAFYTSILYSRIKDIFRWRTLIFFASVIKQRFFSLFFMSLLKQEKKIVARYRKKSLNRETRCSCNYQKDLIELSLHTYNDNVTNNNKKNP